MGNEGVTVHGGAILVDGNSNLSTGAVTLGAGWESDVKLCGWVDGLVAFGGV